MKVQLKKWLRSFLSLKKSEQRGIIILIVIILIINSFNVIVPYIFKPKIDPKFAQNKNELLSFIEEQNRIIDSIDKLNTNLLADNTIQEKYVLTPFPFDPNDLPFDKWKEMGLKEYQIKNIKNYEAKGGKFLTKNDLKKIYTLKAEEYMQLEPFIFFKKPIKARNTKVKNKLIITEINSANESELIKNLGIQKYLAKRLVKFRNLLGGFYIKYQLSEVYGLSDSIYFKIQDFITIDSTLINKLNINTVSFKDLLRHPYFDYTTTKSIINERDRIGKFNNHSQISSIVNDSAFSKQIHYLVLQ